MARAYVSIKSELQRCSLERARMKCSTSTIHSVCPLSGDFNKGGFRFVSIVLLGSLPESLMLVELA